MEHSRANTADRHLISDVFIARMKDEKTGLIYLPYVTVKVMLSPRGLAYVPTVPLVLTRGLTLPLKTRKK